MAHFRENPSERSARGPWNRTKFRFGSGWPVPTLPCGHVLWQVGIAVRRINFCSFCLFFSYVVIGKIKGEGSIKTAQSCGLSLKVSEAWVKGRESFFSFQTYFLLFVLFMTDLGLDKRRSSVTLMVMYTQIVSS